MMMDMAWGVGAVSAPTTTGFGNAGFSDSVINGSADDGIEGFIDGLGFFFQDKDDTFEAKNDTKTISNPRSTYETIENNNSSRQTTKGESAVPRSATVSPTHHPIVTNDTGAVAAIPELCISAPRDERKVHLAETIVSNTKDGTTAMPQPPQLVTSRDSPVNCSTDTRICFQDVLKQQRETILKNQKIIEAQMNELEGKIQPLNQPLALPSIPTATAPAPELSATYSLARAALKKADKQIITGGKGTKGTKRKASLVSTSNPTEANGYQKWKLTPAGATKLMAVDSGGITSIRNSSKHQEIASGKFLSPGELEIRRERNRRHAKKSRLRKKSLTSTLEQSLEVYREENIKLRKIIKDHLAKKKAASDAAAKTVETMLEEHRLRSHKRFTECILTNNRNSQTKSTPKDTDNKNTTSPSGRGVVVDDKTLKVLKGLSKSIAAGTNEPQK